MNPERRLGLILAAVLLAAMVAIALLGLLPHSSRAGAATVPVATAMTPPAPRPLAGKVVGVDPGHNGRNWADPSFINRQVWNGREYESCNTTGTETDGGYTEAQFNWNVGRFLAQDLRAEGAKVVMTRHNNHGVGPCVNKRAEIFNHAHVDVGVAIHGDGGPPAGHGFTVLGPVKDGINHKVIKPSWRFARTLAKTFRQQTGMAYSTYDGKHGLVARNNLAGENLTKVPYSLIECGNMRNPGDAARMVRRSFQKRAAKALAQAITKFLQTG